MPEPIRVLVTGAAGQIAYSLLYSIGNGSVFGKDQPIILVLLDITPMMGVLDGVLMELQDCALPLLKDVIATDKEEVAFKDLDIAVLVGSMPRRDGMERKDLLKANVNIFKTQGAALEKYAKKSVKVIVVGNPANTNCLTASKSAPSIPKENFSCLTRLDHNRAKAQIAIKLGVTSDDVKNVIIWGNHSSTQYPDVNHAKNYPVQCLLRKPSVTTSETSGLGPQRESLCPWVLSLTATPMVFPMICSTRSLLQSRIRHGRLLKVSLLMISHVRRWISLQRN
ncbi:malate dehydrogenase 1 [Phyllostomus discolor]|uniref:Malate dehydrogenase n=1 Tax=Phyllostomus discolor TaxID=89673 RepID=A0A834A5B3_9CHIR|nr:malate dehydrogenase 1 [Phyllostomus discolor]